MWENPIFDRTLVDVDYARANRGSPEALKGAQNYTDWARLTSNMYYLASVINNYGYVVELICKNEWSLMDLPTPSDIEQIRTDIIKLRDAFYTLATTPETPNQPYNHYEKINNLEKILFDINTLFLLMLDSFYYSNQFYSNETLESMSGIRPKRKKFMYSEIIYSDFIY